MSPMMKLTVDTDAVDDVNEIISLKFNKSIIFLSILFQINLGKTC